MDVKSQYTTIPNRDGLLALTHFLKKRPVLQPPSIEYFLFELKVLQPNGRDRYGTRLRPSYVCLFTVHIEEQIFDQYTNEHPICTSGISMTLPEPSLVVGKRTRIFQPL